MKILLIITFVSICSALVAQEELIYFTSFEVGQPQWEAFGDRNDWVKSSGNAHSGDYYWSIDEGRAHSFSYDFIWSEKFLLPRNASHLTVQFYADPEMKRCAWDGFPGWIDELFVLEIDNFTDGNYEETLLQTYDLDYPNPSNGYEFYSVDISSYAGKNVRFRMAMQTDHQDEPAGHGLYFDDFAIISSVGNSQNSELSNDDGIPNDGLHVDDGVMALSKFSPFAKESLQLTSIKFYLYQDLREPINLVCYNENDDEPYELVYQTQIDTSDIEIGWNEVELNQVIRFSEGSFFIGVEGPLQNSTIGFDTDTEGNSFSFSNSTLDALESGNLMIRAKMLDVTSANDENTVTDFKLFQNHPNPFSKGSFGNPTTTIKYSIPDVGGFSPTNVTLKVYDALGREVATLVNEHQRPGNYEVQFNASNLPSGIYFYQLIAGQFSQTKKMVLLR